MQVQCARSVTLASGGTTSTCNSQVPPSCTIPLIQNPLSIPRTTSGEFDQCSEFLVDWSQVLGLTTFLASIGFCDLRLVSTSFQVGNTSLDFEGPLDSVEVGHHQAVNCQYEQEELFQVLNLPQSHNLDCHVTFVTGVICL